MKTPEMFLSKVSEYLVRRCRDLGYLPLVTKELPPNRVFATKPSEDAVFIKLFGHFNYSLNTVHGKFGVLDPRNLRELGELDDRNLALTMSERILLVGELLSGNEREIVRVVESANTLQDIYEVWANT
jgi:hypothetical protein